MQVIPALDMMDGRVVRLTRGAPESMKLYGAGSPLDMNVDQAGSQNTPLRIAHVLDLRLGINVAYPVDLAIAYRNGAGRIALARIVQFAVFDQE